MDIIQEFIVIVTMLLLFMGWWVHNWTVLAKLTNIKGRKIGLSWYVQNRPYKLRISATTSLVSGFIAFIWFNPEAMDLATDPGRQAMAIYLSSMFGIGIGSDFVVDQVGSRAKTYHSPAQQEDSDDGHTLVISKEDREKFIAEEKKNNE